MKLSKDTISILENFSSINASIFFNDGNVIKTRTPGSTVFATAVVAEEFPTSFAVFDLNRLLNAISLFDNPELDFGSDEEAVIIGDGSNSVRYFYTDPRVIEEVVVTPEQYGRTLKLPEVTTVFTLKQEDMARVLKAARILNAPTLSFAGEGGKLKVVAHDSSNSKSDRYMIEVGDTDTDFIVDFKIETIKMLPGTYEVTITSRGICVFKNTAVDIEYAVGSDIRK